VWPISPISSNAANKVLNRGYRGGAVHPSVTVSSFVVELLSELLVLPAGYSGTRNLRKVKSAAISASKPCLVNLSSRQTLPVGRGIQISARGITSVVKNFKRKFR
jgi:hypothetical protein